MRTLELKIPPLALTLAFVACMFGLDRVAVGARFPLPARGALAALLALAGGAVAAAGIVSIRRAGTTVNPFVPEKSSVLVSSGIYSHTRNPMYLGLLLALCGLAAFLANAAAMIVVPLFVAYMNRFQIEPEERALRDRFGAEFAMYAGKVRRWL